VPGVANARNTDRAIVIVVISSPGNAHAESKGESRMNVVQLMASFIKANYRNEFEEYWRDRFPASTTREIVYDSLDYYAGPKCADAPKGRPGDNMSHAAD
jgi:hypothetical protein